MNSLHTIHRSLPVLLVAVLASLVLGACGATDAVDDMKDTADIAKKGLDTAGYLSAVQPQLQAYGAVVSQLDEAAPNTPAKGKQFTAAQTELEKIKGELEKIEPADDYKDAHAQLIAAVGTAADVAGKLGAAATKGDDAEFTRLITEEWGPAQQSFAKSMEAATKPVTDAAEKANDNA